MGNLRNLYFAKIISPEKARQLFDEYCLKYDRRNFKTQKHSNFRAFLRQRCWDASIAEEFYLLFDAKERPAYEITTDKIVVSAKDKKIAFSYHDDFDLAAVINALKLWQNVLE